MFFCNTMKVMFFFCSSTFCVSFSVLLPRRYLQAPAVLLLLSFLLLSRSLLPHTALLLLSLLLLLLS